MKKNYYILILLGLFAVSCSNDDDTTPEEGNNPNPNPTEANYLPSTDGNYWVYNVEGTTSGRDSLYVANDTVINGTTYKKFKTGGLPFGFYSNALNNNGVRESEGKLMVSGIPDLGIPNLPVNIELTDFVIFDQNATSGTVLSTVSGNIPQELEGFNLSVNYALSSKAGETLASYTLPNGVVHTNVKKVEVKLNLSVTVVIPQIPIPLAILPSQDVAVSTQYYADGIGMIHASTDIGYELANLGVELPLPIPQSMSEHQEEVIADYQVE